MREGVVWPMAVAFATLLLISASGNAAPEPTPAEALDFVATAEADLAQETDHRPANANTAGDSLVEFNLCRQ